MTWLAVRALLARVPAVAWLIAGIVVVLSLAAASIYADGRRAEKTDALRTVIKHDVQMIEWHDTVVVHDSVHFIQWVTQYDTVRQTINITDTIAVKRFIAVADSTIGACRQQVLSLYSECDAKDTLIAHQRALLALRVPESHSGAGWRERLTWALAGFAVNEVAHRVR